MTDQTFSTCVEIWPLCAGISRTIYQLTRPIINPLLEELGLAQGGRFFALFTARSYEPEGLSLDRAGRGTPYANPESIWAQWPVKELAERDLLKFQSDGSYRLTAGGSAVMARILKAFYAGLAEIEKSIGAEYSRSDFDRVAAYLQKIVTASLNSSIEKWSLTISHHLAPDGETAALARIDQALDDLKAFREDAHLAAWRPLDLAGPTWELFTFLWRAEVKNADEMAEKAAFRGHSRDTYQSALGDLIGRGWVRAAGENAFEVTGTGRQVCEEVEVATDRNFYTPWLALNEADADDMRDLLARLKTALAQTLEGVPA